MFYRFADESPSFTVFDELRRRLDRVWDEYEEPSLQASSAWPKVTVSDAGEKVVLRADVPGIAEEGFNLTLTPDGLTLAGERITKAPEGYSVQRQERPSAKFSRSWTLPYKVDADQTTATLEAGVLTITLVKAEDAQPRRIPVRAQA